MCALQNTPVVDLSRHFSRKMLLENLKKFPPKTQEQDDLRMYSLFCPTGHGAVLAGPHAGPASIAGPISAPAVVAGPSGSIVAGLGGHGGIARGWAGGHW